MNFISKQYETFVFLLSLQLGIITDIYEILWGSLLPMLRDIAYNPRILLSPAELRLRFFSHVWQLMADGVDENGAESKRELLPARAVGTVLEIGAGSGHSIKYLDPSLVTSYIALEPNAFLHDKIYINATLAGFQPQQITIISCGAEESAKIIDSLRGRQVDTIVSILTLCGLPDLQNTLEGLIRVVLKPGGTFVFYEHVLCDPSPAVQWSQRFWTPVWKSIVGCRLDHHSHYVLKTLPVGWIDHSVWGKKNEQPNLFWHQQGYFVKAKP